MDIQKVCEAIEEFYEWWIENKQDEGDLESE